MSLLNRALALTTRLRLEWRLLRLLFLLLIALVAQGGRSRAIARQAKDPHVPPIATIYESKREAQMGDSQGEMDVAVTVEKDEVATINPQRMATSSHQSRLAIYSARRPSLNLDSSMPSLNPAATPQFRRSHPAFEPSIIETVEIASTSLEAGADLNITRPQAQRELSSPGFDEDVPESWSRSPLSKTEWCTPLYLPEWDLETSPDFWTRLLFEVGIALRFQV